MEYIQPKTAKRKATFSISQRTYQIVSLYARYTHYSEDEVVDMFLSKLSNDERFLNWAQKQRNNKRIIALLDGSESYETELGDSDGEAEETEPEE